MLDHQNSVSIDMRQLSWEFFFIYSNPGKIETTQKISTHELIFFDDDDEHISEVHHYTKIGLMQNDETVPSSKGIQNQCYKETKTCIFPALTFTRHEPEI